MNGGQRPWFATNRFSVWNAMIFESHTENLNTQCHRDLSIQKTSNILQKCIVWDHQRYVSIYGLINTQLAIQSHSLNHQSCIILIEWYFHHNLAILQSIYGNTQYINRTECLLTDRTFWSVALGWSIHHDQQHISSATIFIYHRCIMQMTNPLFVSSANADIIP